MGKEALEKLWNNKTAQHIKYTCWKNSLQLHLEDFEEKESQPLPGIEPQLSSP